jgi:hypothetical protein
MYRGMCKETPHYYTILVYDSTDRLSHAQCEKDIQEE